MKKFKTILSLTLALSISSPIATFAAEKIPGHMTPGTVIQYDSNKQMKVLREGKVEVDPSVIEKFSEVDESILPEIEPDMVVVYDALGAPIIHPNLEKEDIASDTSLDSGSKDIKITSNLGQLIFSILMNLTK